MRWVTAGFIGAAFERNIVASGRVEHHLGAASDTNEWNWSARCTHQRTLKGYVDRGSAPTEAAAKKAAEDFVKGVVAKHGTDDAQPEVR